MEIFKLPKAQLLTQKHERDCGVCVFAALAGVSEEDVLADFPDANLGTVTVEGWQEWLESKGMIVVRREGCPVDAFPCAHLVANVMNSPRDAHWILRDADGDVHDPSPVMMYMPADDERMRNLSMYSLKILTLSVSANSPPS